MWRMLTFNTIVDHTTIFATFFSMLFITNPTFSHDLLNSLILKKQNRFPCLTKFFISIKVLLLCESFKFNGAFAEIVNLYNFLGKKTGEPHQLLLLVSIRDIYFFCLFRGHDLFYFGNKETGVQVVLPSALHANNPEFKKQSWQAHICPLSMYSCRVNISGCGPASPCP